MPVSPLFPPAAPAAPVDYLSALRRLVLIRWAILGLTPVCLVLVPLFLDIPLPWLPLLAVLAVAGLINGLLAWRLRQGAQANARDYFSQISLDILTLAALTFFSGGATNPLVSLLLLPVTLAALSLPLGLAMTAALLAIATYSLLMGVYLPLPLADAARATRLHLIGMWLTFAVSALMLAWFIVAMTARVRQRDAELARAREHALRDERVVALGTLAAGAAHELGTPLATMAVVIGELAHEPDLPDAVRDDLALLKQQIAACKSIITGLSRKAGAERLEQVNQESAERWLDSLRLRWAALRPGTTSRFLCAGQGPAPLLLADPRLEQALLNLLNNAANLTPDLITLALEWDERQITIDVRDNGPGYPPAVLAQGGQQPFPAHAGGSGIGLLLTQAAVTGLHGRLTLSNLPATQEGRQTGGAQARIELPRRDVS